jgi:hypothetical protein
MREARIPKSLFDQIAGFVKQYLTHIVFGRTVDLDDLQVWWRLMQDDARAAVWCEDATSLTAVTPTPQRWRYARIDQSTFNTHHGRTFDGLVRHARTVLTPSPTV